MSCDTFQSHSEVVAPRFAMAVHYYVVVCVLFMIVAEKAQASLQGTSTSTINASTTSSLMSTTVTTTFTPTPKKMTNASVASTTRGHNVTFPSTTPGNNSTTSPATPKLHSSAVPLTNYTTARPTGHQKHSMKPGGGHGDSRGKWVATGFAIFFGITTIVMTFLYFRQRKMNTELEGDSSLSRLI